MCYLSKTVTFSSAVCIRLNQPGANRSWAGGGRKLGSSGTHYYWGKVAAVIPEFRSQFNQRFRASQYEQLCATVERGCGAPIGFRVAETPIFLPFTLLQQLAAGGAEMAGALLADSGYLAAARKAIPKGYCVARETAHPNFLTADFALVRDESVAGRLAPKLVEIQAFPSVFGYQDVLNSAYREVFALPDSLGTYLGGLDEGSYWELLSRSILGNHAPENVVLTEVDPMHQKTLPDFLVTARRLGIKIVNIRSLKAEQNRLWYQGDSGRWVPIHRIYNRAIADELIARNVELPFALDEDWDVEWAGHPNWYFLISKFSIPWLFGMTGRFPAVPPAVFLNDFLDGDGRDRLRSAAVPLPANVRSDTVYAELLLKPLFSFAGKGIQFEPSHAQLEEIPRARRGDYLVQQRMHFEPTIVTPHGLTQAEIRILYLWPDGGELTPALSLVRLGRGKMMGVDHNKNQQWVGASGAFYPGRRE
jgi:hypothetical protein